MTAIDNKELAEKLRSKYTKHPSEGMTPSEIARMKDEELLDMDYFFMKMFLVKMMGTVVFEDLTKIRIHGLEKKNAFRLLCDRICSSLEIVLNYETEVDYPAYTKRMESGNTSCVFFATKQNYEQNFKPLGSYIYKDINTEAFCRNTNIYFLPQAKNNICMNH